MNEPQPNSSLSSKNRSAILLTSVCIIAICGILYELLISTISSYFQGSSILHFSITIGLFLSFMGVGSYLSRYLKNDLLAWFIRFEWLLGLIGGLSTLILYLAFSLTPYFYLIAFGLIAILGSLIGVEIPILTRMVSQYESLKDAMAKVLSFDYIGALFASVAFPLILLPSLGIMRTAFFVGLLNIGVALLNTYIFKDELPKARRFFAWGGIISILLIIGLVFSFKLTSFFEGFLYRDPVIYSTQSPYQHITLTKWNQDIRLFIDGNLQFSTQDEYRYHEPLVHIPMALADSPRQVLILGGGDGIAVRELQKYAFIQNMTLVDLDPEITQLGKEHPILRQINQNALRDPRIEIINQDAFRYLEENDRVADLIIVDLPDPHNASLGKLYSTSFYQVANRRLSVGGVIVTQSTSPYFAPLPFWCIHETMRSVFPATFAYHTYVPSFGQWGFNMAIKISPRMNLPIPDADNVVQKIRQKWQYDSTSFRYLSSDMLPGLFQFDEDTKKRPVEVNQLDNQVLIQYYERSWQNW